jgi:transposase-like protein
MKIKVICQLCGKSSTIETEKPLGAKPRWENYTLFEIGIERHPFSDYEIWVCPECHEEFVEIRSIDYDETGVAYETVEYSDELFETIRDSLREETT